jgi:hypothetical protein
MLGLSRATFLGAEVTLLASRAPLLSTIHAASLQHVREPPVVRSHASLDAGDSGSRTKVA